MQANEGGYGMDPGILALMKNDNSGQWGWFLPWLLLFGRRGFLGDEVAGTGVRSPATLQDLNAAQNSLFHSIEGLQNQNTQAFASAADQSSTNALRTERDIFQTQTQLASANTQNLMGQKDLAAALAACCCDLRVGQQGIINAVEKCCCENQNAIALQTNQLQQTMCNNTQKILDQNTNLRISQLETELGICRDNLSNANQTATLQASIREACCQPCRPPWPWPWMQQGNGNGNGGPPGPPA